MLCKLHGAHRMKFGDIPEEYSALKKSKIVILPVPYDKTSTWIKGANKGPEALIAASANMELYDIETDSEVYKEGIFTDKFIDSNLSPEELVNAVNDKIKKYIADGKFTVLIGGEHSVSIGAIAAYSDKYDDFCVLQLDAHSDLRDEYEGSKFNHACVMARAKENAKIFQVGIRSMDSIELDQMDKDCVVFAKDIQKNKDWIKEVVEKLPSHVYITLDLDVFDPSIMPSTGTPEPGGLLWHEVLDLLREVIRQKDVVGCDVVELCPSEHNKSPDFLAAKLIYKILSYKFGEKKMNKKVLLNEVVKHIDIKSFDSTKIVQSMREMSFTSRDMARAADILKMMVKDKDCTIILTLAGSTSAAGCMQIYVDMVKNNMIDVIVATGASIVDMDFFEALGFKHYKGSPFVDDRKLREQLIDRIYDTYIDEEELQECDKTIKEIADSLEPKPYSSREFIKEMGKYLVKNAKKKDSLVQAAYEHNVPIFCPAFSDCSAGFGLVLHQHENPDKHVSIDSVKDFRELTLIKMKAKTSGLFMIGGGVPKNFAQDTVVCAEVLGKEVPMHKYAVQITVADSRDGACSSSTLKEAASWGKVDTVYEQMVYAEATSVLPLIVSYVYHAKEWENRIKMEWSKIFD